eukprot:gene10002-2321_t
MKVLIPTKYFLRDLQKSIKKSDIKFQTPNYIILKKDAKLLPLVYPFTQNIWSNCFSFKHETIEKTIKKLKEERENWIFFPSNQNALGKKIEQNFEKFKFENLKFPPKRVEKFNFGYFLIDKETNIVGSSIFSNQISNNGEINFIENKSIPSRAYLKLFEALTLINKYPKEGEFCVDFGSSPGSWSFVLSYILRTNVYSVDKSNVHLDLKNFVFEKRDAFKIEPTEIFNRFGKINWFFSDIICEPEKLLIMIKKWLSFDFCENFVVTIKFKGDSLTEENLKTLNEFISFSNSKLIHLFHNKNELCWIRIK